MYQKPIRAQRCSVPAIVAVLASACVVDRPTAEETINKGRDVDLFALDCRAWHDAGSSAFEVEASLIDFGEGEPHLDYTWSLDGKEASTRQETRPIATGEPVKYRLVRKMRYETDTASDHLVTVLVRNGRRTAGCTVSVRVRGTA